MSSRALNGMASIPCNQFICSRRSIGDKMRSLRSDLSRRPLFSGLLQKKRNLRRTKTPAILFGLSLKLSALDVNGAVHRSPAESLRRPREAFQVACASVALLQRRATHRQKERAISGCSLRSTAKARYCMPLGAREPGMICKAPPRTKSLTMISGATRRHFPVMTAGRAR